jgi:hypothetical protein
MTPLEWSILIIAIILFIVLLVWLIKRTKGTSIDSGGLGAFTDLSVVIDSASDWSGDGGSFSGGGSSGSFDFDIDD